ncbi:hypothetical protein [Desulfitobacterium chlororespirans]|uniref:Abortive infection C-terminus n=1 Tax=Desulfitobacterium chlororespirans DSM 11544 TaxID=1121395 RepID=A0A1M7UYG9_9FIRM|nr:hypothetical protein [Desulfitobacterium chlororespirans]SHN87995.1 hypothetical protein SAMN02745215_05076 [Desulfitobacterium chlororespirans DSM 11544]
MALFNVETTFDKSHPLFDILGINEKTLNINGINVVLGREFDKDNKIIRNVIHAELSSDSLNNAISLFSDAIKQVCEMIVFLTNHLVKISPINCTNASCGTSQIENQIDVTARVDLPEPYIVLDNIDVISNSNHLKNAFNYYELAMSTHSTNERVLYLYKVVESIIGYPGKSKQKFKDALRRLGIKDEDEKHFKQLYELRKIRNEKNVGHSAGGEINGNTYYKDVEIPMNIVKNGSISVVKLISATILYLSQGNDIKEVFVPKQKMTARKNSSL